MDTERKTFEKWFKKQFGKLPMNTITRKKIESRHQVLRDELARVNRELERDNLANEQMKVALYVRIAAPSRFTF